MRTVTSEVFKFDELGDDAKERARAWWRESLSFDDWWDASYDDFAQCADILGINLRQRPVKLMNGSTRYDPAIYFRGFSSQGDGACFEGTYSYRKGSSKAIRQHAPQDTELHRIADELTQAQRKAWYRATASISHRGHYSHSGCMDIDVDDCEDPDSIRQPLRDFADWMYSQLEKEFDYQNSDEQVDETIRINEYEFDADGNRS